MASIQIKNGQEITGTGVETEIQLEAGVVHAREIKFRVISGTMQVTTGRRNSVGIIGGNIHAYATGEPDYMTIEPNIQSGNASSLYIKGTGTIFFSF